MELVISNKQKKKGGMDTHLYPPLFKSSYNKFGSPKQAFDTNGKWWRKRSSLHFWRKMYEQNNFIDCPLKKKSVSDQAHVNNLQDINCIWDSPNINPNSEENEIISFNRHPFLQVQSWQLPWLPLGVHPEPESPTNS